MMRSSRLADGSFVVTCGEWLPYLLGTLAAGFAGTLVYDVTVGTRGMDRMAGLLGGVAVLGFGAVALSERTRFVFNPNVNTVTWQRRWLVYRRGGTLRFGDVRQVAFQVSIGSKRVLSRRICLMLADATQLPLATGYSPDAGGEMRRLADELCQLLGVPLVDDGPGRAGAEEQRKEQQH